MLDPGLSYFIKKYPFLKKQNCQEKSDDAKVDKVGGRTETWEVFP